MSAIREDPKDPKHVKDLIEKRTEAIKKELAVLAEAFYSYDRDGSGFLDRAELEEALQDLELPHGEIDVVKVFERLDMNKDGAVTLNEWLEALPQGARVRINEQADDKFGAYVQFALPQVKLMWTLTDEAPMLATYSLLPIVKAFAATAKLTVEKKDISVAARILSTFPDYLKPEQQVEDDLVVLGTLAKRPEANIIKLPNISASVPQLTAAVKELQSKGYAVPDYPMNPVTDAEKEIRTRYAKVLGSAVNPVLREGNSDRRVAPPVKRYAQKNPHKLEKFEPTQKSHVAYMKDGDFYGSEKSAIMGPHPCSVRIELVHGEETTVLKAKTALQGGEIIDGSVIRIKPLREFFEKEMQDAQDMGILFSLHMKATMMKVSDPVIFGHAVQVYYKSAFAKHQALFERLGVNSNNGLGDVYAKIATLPEAEKKQVEADLMACYAERPQLAYVDSRRGITNLHVPSDVIIDASMAAAIRDGGRMWTKEDKLADVKFTIPDRCYATIYDVVVKDCIKNGSFDVTTMGNVANVGLMAQKAEEYGSHDKTFELADTGTVRVVDRATGEVYFEHAVEKGDIWRMCQTKDSPVKDWVKLAVTRAKATGLPAIFWLDPNRAHDANMIKKVEQYLPLHDTSRADIQILSVDDAMRVTLERVRAGQDTISCTGNVLRDYLTDLFPIMELGTSAKMLSVVPLLAGGSMFETGAGGSAPKHVQQLVNEGHLRWDSLGEFLALACSLEDLSAKMRNPEAKVLADTLNDAVGTLMDNNKNPGRKAGELDNRGSHYYLALYWAQALAAQAQSPQLRNRFAPVAAQLAASEVVIVEQLKQAAGKPIDLGGYYACEPFRLAQIMRPSPAFNTVIDALTA